MKRLLCVLTMTSLALWSASVTADVAFDDPCETQNLEDGTACVDENGVEGTCQSRDCVPSVTANNDANNDGGGDENNEGGEEGEGDEGDQDVANEGSDDDSGCASVGSATVPVGSLLIGLGLALFLGRPLNDDE